MCWPSGIPQRAGKASFGGTMGSASLKLPFGTSMSISTALQGCSEREGVRGKEKRGGRNRESRRRGQEREGKRGFVLFCFF